MDIEINTGNAEKFIPHPILDDTDRMMRIIANPLYDKLTIARAGNIRKPPSGRKSVKIAEPKEQTIMPPISSLNHNEPIIMSLQTNNNEQSQRKSYSKRQSLPPISLLARSSTHRISPGNSRPSAISRTSSLHSSTATTTTTTAAAATAETDKKLINDGNIRYVNTRHGFEIQRYSSPNWLSVDLLAKDACESREKSFRDMVNQKEQNDLSSRSVYTTEYYRQRFDDLLQSFKDGHLSHDQWARQNYQLNCLQTFYAQAYEREQQRLGVQERSQRQRRAQSVFNEWKEAKGEGHNETNRSRLHLGFSHRGTEVNSVLSNPSSSFANQARNRMSIASIMEDQTEELPVVRPIKQLKQPTQSSDVFNEQRWSLNAMLKRVVGLAEPLPPPSIPSNYRRLSVINVSSDSGFESSP